MASQDFGRSSLAHRKQRTLTGAINEKRETFFQGRIKGGHLLIAVCANASIRFSRVRVAVFRTEASRRGLSDTTRARARRLERILKIEYAFRVYVYRER